MVKPTTVSFIPAAIWTIIIFVLLVMPGSDMPANDFFELIYFDKWVHFGLFGVLTFFLGYPFIQLKKSAMNCFVVIAFFAALYGIVMEFVQKYFTTTRTFDITDIIADTAGVLFAFFLLKKSNKKKHSCDIKK